MIAVDNLDLANMVVAVAAGNSGPGHYTIESPGAAARALTAGAQQRSATIIARAGHRWAATTARRCGDFPTVSSDLTAPLGVVDRLDRTDWAIACTALPTGILDRQDRPRLARQLLVLGQDPQRAGGRCRRRRSSSTTSPAIRSRWRTDGTAEPADDPGLHGVAVDDGQTLKSKGGAATTIGATLAVFPARGNDDIMCSNSSQGPTDVDFRVKPDVVAPGVNVLSSIPVSVL